MIVGLAGKKRVGKSTAARWLADKGFVRMSYADGMKRMARAVSIGCGLSEDQVAHYMEHKEEVMPVVGVTMRHFLQSLGTDWGRRMINPDIWVMAAAVRLDTLQQTGCHADIVVEDVRFENEAADIRRRGGMIIHIERNTGLSDPHESEAGISFRSGDVLIYNSEISMEVFRLILLSAAGAL